MTLPEEGRQAELRPTARPILFSDAMVRALLAGHKTQTRRLATSPLAKAKAGDRLWVRETWAKHQAAPERIHIKGEGHPWGSPIYRATFGAALAPVCEGFSSWKPSIHMPRWASRLTLAVTGVRVEPLQKISDKDATAEGVYTLNSQSPGLQAKPYYRSLLPASSLFRYLWESLHGEESWEANPLVVAITFAVWQRNIDAEPKP